MTTSDDPALLDTNILVYATDSLSPFHTPCRELRERGRRGQLILCVTPQVLFGFYAVVTGPRRVSRPLTVAYAVAEVMLYLDDPAIRTIFQGPDVMNRMGSLVRKYSVKRQEIFDILIVATMLSNDVKRIYTYDVEHFSRFEEIEVLSL